MSDDNPDQRVEPVHENEPVNADEPVMVEESVHVDEQVNTDDLAHNTNLPIPVCASSPLQEVANIIPSRTVDDAEMTITGEAHKAPDASNALAKIVAKDELATFEKGRLKLELPNFEDLNVDKLHQG
jgi:hypothetical protein